mmetsp:Transcript_41875/g.68934  ORF Transcript_41875/g.68934 Transcript_41875/m.68934 type:complete len:345 (+) Transcript_41875:100-1134(+)|eukprot:CAMPEP_0202697928 /NCGR_PEP_ID=MMETSP1385-20130828/11221_1 /ASSEMBLY_ACC=CAM_ASM_000861 /TAXON_ID=933848 /ORGANISM="Elphidium margaritaceum" /LENGTH=344 /DNA_ID=CAMNT_0049354507 /DNA_START=82 /DNA_END=1116 /DNA_ORIENTATION=+
MSLVQHFWLVNALLLLPATSAPYNLSRISKDSLIDSASLFDYPYYISSRPDPVVWSDDFEQNEKLRFFDQNGYLLLPEFIDAEVLQTYQQQLSELVDDIVQNTTEDDQDYVVYEPGSNGSVIRHIFEVHKDIFYDLSTNDELLSIVRSILDSDVYVHQSRVNLKAAFHGESFRWHSDFEAWHVEDGMPKPRAVSMMLLLDDVYSWNGALMGIPGSHKFYLHCVNDDGIDGVEEKNWEKSLAKLRYGTPNEQQIKFIFEQSSSSNGIEYIGAGKKGSVLLFDANLMHASYANMSPMSRNAVFMVYNAIENALKAPPKGYGRPGYLAERDANWIKPIDQCTMQQRK